MSAVQLLATSSLLGLFVLLAFGYGVLYGLGRLRARRGLIVAGYISYGLQCLVVAAVLAFTPLLGWWKALIALSSAVYFVIPPVTWRSLVALHRLEEDQP